MACSPSRRSRTIAFSQRSGVKFAAFGEDDQRVAWGQIRCQRGDLLLGPGPATRRDELKPQHAQRAQPARYERRPDPGHQ